MTSYRADYCHPSSGKGDSTGGGRALADVQHMIESAWVGQEVAPGHGCSEVSQRTGTHFSSLSQIWRDSLCLECVEPVDQAASRSDG